MDKELDDLLDSALDDFEKKPSDTFEQADTASNVTIERTNLYVDEELDDEDRPIKHTLPNSKTSNTATTKSSTNQESSTGCSKTKAGSDDDFKLFEEIFAASANSGEANSESLNKFKEMLELLKSGTDETKIMQNFEKVMSDLANQEIKFDSDDNLDDLDDLDDAELSKFDMDFLKNLASGSSATSTSTATVNTSTANASNKSSDENKPSQSNENTSSASTSSTNPFHKVLQDLNKNSEKVLNSSDPFSSFSKDLFSSLQNETNNLDVDSDDDPSASLMMQPILSMLFSKDILYPSLKMMNENFEKYIVDKKDQLSAAELEKCNFQKDCISQMCTCYESSKEDDTKEEKAKQLKQILDLLEKCGMPPSELVPEVNPFEALGSNGCPIS